MGGLPRQAGLQGNPQLLPGQDVPEADGCTWAAIDSGQVCGAAHSPTGVHLLNSGDWVCFRCNVVNGLQGPRELKGTEGDLCQGCHQSYPHLLHHAWASSASDRCRSIHQLKCGRWICFLCNVLNGRWRSLCWSCNTWRPTAVTAALTAVSGAPTSVFGAPAAVTTTLNARSRGSGLWGQNTAPDWDPPGTWPDIGLRGWSDVTGAPTAASGAPPTVSGASTAVHATPCGSALGGVRTIPYIPIRPRPYIPFG